MRPWVQSPVQKKKKAKPFQQKSELKRMPHWAETWDHAFPQAMWRSLGIRPTSWPCPVSTSGLIPPLGIVYSSFALLHPQTSPPTPAKTQADHRMPFKRLSPFYFFGKGKQVFPSHMVEIYTYVHIYTYIYIIYNLFCGWTFQN
jgi:hypothetical protein